MMTDPPTSTTKAYLCHPGCAVVDLEPRGAWIVTSYNYDPIPAALFDNELDARRWADTQGYGDVDFWPFGTEWSQRWRGGVR